VTSPHKSTKKDNITIGELVLGSVEPHGTSSWTQVLKVPPLPPSNLNNCSIIDLDYDLKVSYYRLNYTLDAQVYKITLSHK
jgi:hypothetical protein